MVGVVLLYAPPCGYCLEASMTGPAAHHPVDSRLRGNDGPGIGTMQRIVFTLTFDSSPIKGEGIGGWFGLVVAPRHTPPLWIDESPMNLVEILGFQPKGVATL